MASTSKATKARTARGGSQELFERLHEYLGEKRLTVVLETVGNYLSSTQKESGTLEQLRSANSVRLHTLRALILHDALSSDQVRAYVNRSRPIVNKMAKEGKLLAIHDGRVLRFPRWQFDRESENGILRHFQEVLSVMDASPFRKAAWFVTKNPHLKDRTPIQLLRVGQIQLVLEEAKALVGS